MRPCAKILVAREILQPIPLCCLKQWRKGNLSRADTGMVCGLQLAKTAFLQMDSALEFRAVVQDGAEVRKDDLIATIHGNARAVLSAERVALNYLMHMSGIATFTAGFVSEVKHTRARICCTRKTVPGNRIFAKYAVRCGGRHEPSLWSR